jgi:hypothetical protein
MHKQPSDRGINGATHETLFLKRQLLPSVNTILILFVILAGTAYVLSSYAFAPTAHAAASNSAVLTYKSDTLRTGQYPNETILNTGNVNSSHFGKHVSYPVDGQVYAQPLFVPNLSINGGTHNVAFVSTEHDSVYAFDADQKSAISPLWHVNFTDPSHSINTVSSANDVHCTVLSPEYGITGTATIDVNAKTMYVVAATREPGGVFEHLHALDITTGKERSGSPLLIKASVPGTGDGSVNGIIDFNASHQLQRPGLLLMNGIVYIAFGSYCDQDPYHGWIIGYDSTSLQQTTVYNNSRNGVRGAIWQSGGGLVGDTNGNIYYQVGNGTFDINTGGPDIGDAVVKLSTLGGLKLVDYFAPFNQGCLDTIDLDLGSAGALLIPSHNELISVGKEGRIAVLNRDKLGKYTIIHNPCSNQNLTNVDKVLQELPPNTASGGCWSTPAYWNGSTGEYVYFGEVGDHVKAFKLTNGLLSTSPTSQTPESLGYPGGNVAISSNGPMANTGIVWVIDPSATLRAYDATNLGHELFNSKLPSYIKFTTPIIANGEVFIGTGGSLEIYGPI